MDLLANVENTLKLPLYGRKYCTENAPTFFRDDIAVPLCDELKVDYSNLKYPKFVWLTFGMRPKHMVNQARKYLVDHPDATIIDLGAGFDTLYALLDNGHCHLINADLPRVIDLRNQLIPLGERETNLTLDLSQDNWIDKLKNALRRVNETEEDKDWGEKGVVFLSAGVLFYFKPEESQHILSRLAESFPGGEITFDWVNEKGGEKSSKMVEDAGNENAPIQFTLNDPEKELSGLSTHFKKISATSFISSDGITLRECGLPTWFIVNFISRIPLKYLPFKSGFATIEFD